MTPCRAFPSASRLAGALALCLAMAMAMALAAPSPLRAADDNDWSMVLEALRRQDQIVHTRLEEFKSRHAAEAAAQAEELEQLLRERARLALWQATASDPWEIRDVLAGFARLRGEVARLAQRPQQVWASLDQSALALETYKDRLDDITRQEVPERFRQEIEPSRQAIASLRENVAAARDAVAEETGALRDLSGQVGKAEAALQANLASSWKAYYSEIFPSPVSAFFLQALSQNLEDWDVWIGLCSELLRTRHNQRELWRGAATGGGLALAALAAALVVARLSRRGVQATVNPGTIVKAGGCVAAGVFFLAVAQRAPFFLFTGLSSIGEILLTASLVHLSRLRRPNEAAPPRPPILWPTWRLFALGLLLEAVRVPEIFMGPILAVVLAVAAVAFFKRRKATPPRQRLDRAITTTLAFLLPLLAGLALCGLPQTAVLGASFLFYVGLALRYAGLTTRFLDRRETDRHPAKPHLLLAVAAAAGYPFFFLTYLFLFLWLLSTQFGGENVFLELLTTETHIESVGISLKKIVTLLAGFYATRAGMALAAAGIAGVAARRRDIERGAKASLLTINTYGWWGLYALFAMSVLGLSLTSVAVVAGGLSVGIGFGLQTMVNNFISGLILLFGRSVQAGDTIQLGDSTGVVKEVNIRNTEVLTTENATVFVPNAELVSGKIVNWSHRDPSVRRDIGVGVAYGSDTGQVRELLLAAAASCPAVLGNPPATVLHWDFGPSTLDFRLRVWLADVAGAVTAACTIREAIDRLFRQAGIEIAFPQADLHLRSAPILERLLDSHLTETRQRLEEHAVRLNDLERKTRRSEVAAGGPQEEAPHDPDQ
uniref:Small-conductance mechanosensitive channel n=1 Tax=Desulfovibrio sp. U5L TaxID=596152 RepID=I2Q4A4_9BACT